MYVSTTKSTALERLIDSVFLTHCLEDNLIFKKEKISQKTIINNMFRKSNPFTHSLSLKGKNRKFFIQSELFHFYTIS